MKKVLSLFAFALAVACGIITLAPALAEAAPTLDLWWPVDGAHMQGTQPFKALLEGVDPSHYQISWSVDGGQQNAMSENNTDYPHYGSAVDLAGWTWRGAGPYAVTFTASEGDAVVATKTVHIYVDNGLAAPSTQSTQPAATPAPAPAAAPQLAPAPAPSPSYSISMWWPLPNASVIGPQPFKALVPGLDVNSYTMYWSVDGGQENLMPTNDTDAPHKEAQVDLSGWTWRGAGPYTLTFTAENLAGEVIATTSFPITNAGVASSPSPSVSASPFYVNPNSTAAAALASEPNDPATALLAATPSAIWLGAWSGDIKSAVASTTNDAAAKHEVPIFVSYNIPDRDCGGYSAGGAEDDVSYSAWIESLAAGLGQSPAIVILEPDSLSVTSCLSQSQLADREALLSSAVSALKADANAKVYIDAGHENWVDPNVMASELRAAGIASANGFAVNVSNYMPTAGEEAYGAQVSAALGGKHFVIDTSRNGNGSDGAWCNPPGRAIGATPTTNTGDPLADAFLWIKTPGESDGACNGGPAAGTWWQATADALVANAL